MMMVEEDKKLHDACAGIKGPCKTYRSDEIAIFWDLKNIKNEIMMHYLGKSPLGTKLKDIGGDL